MHPFSRNRTLLSSQKINNTGNIVQEKAEITKNNPLLYACEFDGKGGARELAWHDVDKSTRKTTWVHMDMTNPETHKWLTEKSGLEDFVIEALLDEEARPRTEEVGDGAIVILRGVNLNENAEPEDMVSIRIWIEQKRIISVRRHRLKVVEEIEEKIKNGKGPKTVGDFIVMLSTRLFERMEPVLFELDKMTDDSEEKVLDSPDTKLRSDIIDIRKRAIMLRRYISPQRDAITHLRMSEMDWLDSTHVRRLQENYNILTRYVEDLDAIRERSQIIKDELGNVLADRLNKNMYMLSLIASIFLPLGFLTGLLGVNLGGIPGAESHLAFFVFLLIMIVVVIGQIYIFKKFKWF